MVNKNINNKNINNGNNTYIIYILTADVFLKSCCKTNTKTLIITFSLYNPETLVYV